MRRPRSDHEFDAWLRQHEPAPPAAAADLRDRILDRQVPAATLAHGTGVRRLAIPGLFWLAAAAALVLWWTANPQPDRWSPEASELQTQVVASLLDDLELRLAGERLAALERRFEDQESRAREATADAATEETATPTVPPSLALMEQRVTEAGLDESPAGLVRLVALQSADPDILGRPYVARCARELAQQYPDSFTSREALRFAASLDR